MSDPQPPSDGQVPSDRPPPPPTWAPPPPAPPPPPPAPAASPSPWAPSPPTASASAPWLPVSALPPEPPAGGPSWTAPPPPPTGSLPPYPAAEPPPSGRRSPARWAALAIAALALLAGTGFAAYALTRPDGADSPEAAVHQMFEAIDHEDAIAPPPPRLQVVDDRSVTFGGDRTEAQEAQGAQAPTAGGEP